ncbi:hypothetical protein D3C81_1668230 [compost metagenome]
MVHAFKGHAQKASAVLVGFQLVVLALEVTQHRSGVTVAAAFVEELYARGLGYLFLVRLNTEHPQR